MAKAKFIRTKPQVNVGTIGHVDCPENLRESLFRLLSPLYTSFSVFHF